MGCVHKAGVNLASYFIFIYIFFSLSFSFFFSASFFLTFGPAGPRRADVNLIACGKCRKISLSVHRSGWDPGWMLSGWCIGGSSMAFCLLHSSSSSSTITIPAHRGVKPAHPRLWAFFVCFFLLISFKSKVNSKRMR